MATDRITPALQTSQVFRIRGQRSKWRYPHERLTPEHTRKLTNVNLTERATAQTRFGYTPWDATVLAGNEPVTGFEQVSFAGGDQQYIVTPTKIYMSDGTTQKDVTGSALTAGNDDRARILLFSEKALINNGVDQIQVHDGDFATPSSAAALTGTIPFTKALDITTHKNVAVVAGTTEGGTFYPTRLRWCDVDRRTYTPDINTWVETNRTEIYGGGPPIVGMVENWDRLWIFKEDGVYTGEITTQVGRFEFVPGPVQRGFEPIAKLSFVAHPNFVFGVGRDGAFVFRQDGSFEKVTDDIDDEWQNLNLGRLKYAQARIRERDNQVRVLMSTSSNSNGHDTELVWDWDTGDVWFDPLTDIMSSANQLIIDDEELDFYGSFAGDLFKGNVEGQLTDNGTDIQWDVEMAPNDLGLPGKTKEIAMVRTYVRSKPSSQSITLTVELDQGRKLSRIKTLTAGSDLTYNDGTSTYNSGLKYPGGTNEVLTYWVNRQCEIFAPTWSGTDASDVIGYDVSFRVLE